MGKKIKIMLVKLMDAGKQEYKRLFKKCLTTKPKNNAKSKKSKKSR